MSHEQQLLARLERLPFARPHLKLMVQGGFGIFFDGFDGQLLAYAVPVLVTAWHLTSGDTGWLLAAYFIGILIGSATAGLLGDRIGRRRLIVSALIVYAAFSVVLATSQSYAEFFIWRIVQGIGIAAESAVVVPFVSEFVSRRVRGRVAGSTVGFASLGLAAAALVANAIIPANPDPGWRYAAVIGVVPIVLLLWWRRSLPESPRYLLSKGRIAEAEAVVERFERETERATGRPLEPVTSERSVRPLAVVLPLSHGGISGILDDLRRQLITLWAGRLARQTAILWVLWFTLQFGIYGFASWLPTLLVDQGLTLSKSFTYTMIALLSQVPGYYGTALLLNDRFQRKHTIAVAMIGAAACALGVGLANSETQLVVFSSLLSLCQGAIFASAYVYSAEIYPTAVRTSGAGMASAVGRLGAILAQVAIGYIYGGIGFAAVFVLLCLIFGIGGGAVAFFGKTTTGSTLEDLEAASIVETPQDSPNLSGALPVERAFRV